MKCESSAWIRQLIRAASQLSSVIITITQAICTQLVDGNCCCSAQSTLSALPVPLSFPPHPTMSASSPPGSAVELQALMAKLDQSTPAPYSLATELLAFLTAQHVHAPKLVVKYGKQLILHHKGKLGDRGPTTAHRTHWV